LAGLFDRTRTHGHNGLQNSVGGLVEENLVRAAWILTCAQEVSGLIPVRKPAATINFRYVFLSPDKQARVPMFVIVTDKTLLNKSI